jgi:hypothetical protein
MQDATTAPVNGVLPVLADAIPAELRERPQWVLWRQEERGKAKPTKLPYQVQRGRKAAADNPATWTTHLGAMTAYVTGGYSGIGFVFAADDPYCGIDLDGCRDPHTGTIAEWARTIIDRCASYSEVSPSGTGVKIFARGKLPSATGKKREVADAPKVCDKRPAIEVYDHGRYFAVTGHALPGSPSECRDCQPVIDAIFGQFFMPKKNKRSGQPSHHHNGHAHDAIERCRKYVAKMPAAIEGQGGHDATFAVACECFRFGLSDGDAAAVLNEYNQRCQPEWSVGELRHKLESAWERVTAEGEFGCRLQEQRTSGSASRIAASAEAGDRALPEIELGHDEMRVADETIAALAKRDDLHQRGGVLVEIRESPEPPPCIVRPDGGIRAAAIAKWRLRELIADSVSYKKVRATEDGEQWIEAAVPMTTVEQVLARGVWRGIAPLEGIVTSPQVLLDGSVLIQPGYDKRSGLYFADGERFAPIADAPTKADAERARGELLEVVADFPIDDTSKAAWLAIALTGAARHGIDGPTPLFAIDANVRGSGKSLAADAIGIIHTGRQLPRTSAAGNDEEMRKRITAICLSGEPLVLLDNINGVLGCAALDALLTSATWTDRILGESAMTAVLPAKAIWLATGNNLQFAADTARRTLRIRLESQEENPEERTGFTHPNLLAWVRAERGRLASAAVTILRAWHVAGRPDMKLPPWGSFDSWSGIVRNAVVWCGLPDPGATRQEVQRESDREAMLLRQLLNAWIDADPHAKGLTVVDAMKEADGGNVVLTSIFAELADRSGKVNARSIGQKLRHLMGRVCGGKYFDRRDTNRGAAWLVRTAGESDSTDSSDSKPSPPQARTHAHAHTRTIGAETTVTTPSTVTPCNHTDPATWIRRDGKAYCPGCDRFFGNVQAAT